jgi:hypothetical protein
VLLVGWEEAVALFGAFCFVEEFFPTGMAVATKDTRAIKYIGCNAELQKM